MVSSRPPKTFGLLRISIGYSLYFVLAFILKMMELKFRAWTGINYSYFTFERRNVHRNLMKDYIIEQFTELKDKNGTEIYEGDIVKIKELEYDNYDTFAVEYEDIGWAPFINPDAHVDGTFCYSSKKEHLEVIGNIHKNSELLVNN